MKPATNPLGITVASQARSTILALVFGGIEIRQQCKSAHSKTRLLFKVKPAVPQFTTTPRNVTKSKGRAVAASPWITDTPEPQLFAGRHGFDNNGLWRSRTNNNTSRRIGGSTKVERVLLMGAYSAKFRASSRSSKQVSAIRRPEQLLVSWLQVPRLPEKLFPLLLPGSKRRSHTTAPSRKPHTIT